MRKLVLLFLLVPTLAHAASDAVTVVPIAEKDQQWLVGGLHLGLSINEARQSLESNGYRCNPLDLSVSRSREPTFRGTLRCQSAKDETGSYPNPSNIMELQIAFKNEAKLAREALIDTYSEVAPIFKIRYVSNFHPNGDKYFAREQLQNSLIQRYGEPVETRGVSWFFANGDATESTELRKKVSSERSCDRKSSPAERVNCHRIRAITVIAAAAKNVVMVDASALSDKNLVIEMEREGYWEAVNAVSDLARWDAEKAKLERKAEKGPVQADF